MGIDYNILAGMGRSASEAHSRGIQDSLVLEQLELDRTTRNALQGYLDAPEANRGNAFNALMGLNPEIAADVMTIQNAQADRTRVARQRQARASLIELDAIEKSSNPGLAFRLMAERPDEDNPWRDLPRILHEQGAINLDDGITDEEAKLIIQFAKPELSAIALADQADGVQFGLSPQYGVNAAGDPVLLQLSSGGRAVETAMPPGVTLSRNPIKLDAGTHFVLLDPITRQPVGEIPKDVAGEQSERVIGEEFGKQYTEMQQGSFAASGTLNRLDRMESLLSNIETGKLAGVEKTIGELGEAFGVDVEGLDETQAFTALSNELALQMRNPAGGAGMPGAMSDADREFLRSTVPNLQNTQGGNRLILEYGRRMARRQQEVAARARAYKSRHGSIDESFFDELDEWSAAHPLFEKENALLEVGRATAPGAPASSAPADPLSALTPEQRAKYGL